MAVRFTAPTALGLRPWEGTRTSEPLAPDLGLVDMARDADWMASDGETLDRLVTAGRRPAAEA